MILRSHTQLTDQEFEERFANCSFPPRLFSHEAHLRLAWIHLRAYGLEQALDNLRTQIRQFAVHVGVANKYHETITSAAVYAVDHFLQQQETDSFQEFIALHQPLLTDFKALINSHYSKDIFKDPNARKVFIEPDVEPF
ncbi:MAG: hypothetical protein AAFV07_06890 [Bacteroidota bacterium]